MHNLLSWTQLVHLLLDVVCQLLTDLGKVSNDSVLDGMVSSQGVNSDVVGQVLLLVRISSQSFVQSLGLSELSVSSLPVEWAGSTLPNLLLLLELELLSLKLVGGREVVWSAAQVTVDIHETISHVWVEDTSNWAVDWNLLVVDTQSVSVGVWVREQSGLQHWVSRWLHVWNSVTWREGSLLDISEVVLWVLVQNELTESSQWVVLVWPDLGQVKDGEWSSLGLLGSHSLDVSSPRWVVSLGNLLEQVLLGMVWVGTRQFTSLLVGQGLDTLVGDEVNLNVVPVSVLVRPLVGVTGVTVHLSVGGGGTTVREQDSDLVSRLLVGGQVVPEHVWVLQVSLGTSLLGVDEVGELGRVTKEENRGVVVNKVQVTLLGVQLGGETTRVSGSISRARLTTDSGETGEGLGLLTDGVQEFGATDVSDIVSDLEVSESTGTLSMNNSLRDSLSVKVSKRVDQVKILQQQWAVLTNTLTGEWVWDRTSVGIGEWGRHI